MFCEVALCPGMQWGRLSSKQGDLWFVPLAGTHYTESECCFHVVFHLSLGFEQNPGAPRKESASKFPKKKRKPRAGRAVPGSGSHPFPGEDGRSSFSTANSEKSNHRHKDLVFGWFVNCIKNPFCDVFAVAWSWGGALLSCCTIKGAAGWLLQCS